MISEWRVVCLPRSIFLLIAPVSIPACQMIQLLPSSYNQKRTVMLNYEVLSNIYQHRRNHKLDEWRELF